MCQCGCPYENYWGDCTEFKINVPPPCREEIEKEEENKDK